MLEYYENFDIIIRAEDEDFFPEYAVQRWDSVLQATEEEVLKKAEKLISIAVDNEKHDDIGAYPLAKFPQFDTQYIGSLTENEYKIIRDAVWDYGEWDLDLHDKIVKKIEEDNIEDVMDCGYKDAPMCAITISNPKLSLKFTNKENKNPVVFFGTTEYEY